MLLAPRRAVPAAQTLQQPGLGGSRLPSQAAGPQQPQGGLRGHLAPGMSPGAGMSTHLRPRETIPRLPLRGRVPAASVRAIPALQRLSTPRPPLPSPPPTQAVTRGQAAPGSDTRGRSAGRESGQRQGEGRGGARMRGRVGAPARLGGAAGGQNPQEGMWSST